MQIGTLIIVMSVIYLLFYLLSGYTLWLFVLIRIQACPGVANHSLSHHSVMQSDTSYSLIPFSAADLSPEVRRWSPGCAMLGGTQASRWKL